MYILEYQNGLKGNKFIGLMAEPKTLYPYVFEGTSKLRITNWPKEERGHLLFIQGTQYALMRGILEELARSDDIGRFARKLNQVDPTIAIHAEEEGISLPALKDAFCEAREIEARDEEAYVQEMRRARKAEDS